MADYRPVGRKTGPVQQNIPEETTSFVGRAAELARLAEALREQRLVTLVGGAGVGEVPARPARAGHRTSRSREHLLGRPVAAAERRTPRRHRGRRARPLRPHAPDAAGRPVRLGRGPRRAARPRLVRAPRPLLPPSGRRTADRLPASDRADHQQGAAGCHPRGRAARTAAGTRYRGRRPLPTARRGGRQTAARGLRTAAGRGAVRPAGRRAARPGAGGGAVAPPHAGRDLGPDPLRAGSARRPRPIRSGSGLRPGWSGTRAVRRRSGAGRRRQPARRRSVRAAPGPDCPYPDRPDRARNSGGPHGTAPCGRPSAGATNCAAPPSACCGPG